MLHEDTLKKHLELVIEANKKTNITRIDTWEEGMVLHVEDSLIGLPEVNDAPQGKLVDIGSGAGYPGIPLAVESGRETLLVDSVGKKTAILDAMIGELGLSHVSTYTGRIEDLARTHQEEFAVVTARALAKLSVLMEFAAPLLMLGGRLVCYKANVEQEELEHACSLQKDLGMKLCTDRVVPLHDYSRRILCFEKVEQPRIKLPRKTGLAQKKPL